MTRGASNAQKTPFARSLNDWATARWGAALDLEGKSLPASVVSVNNSIVTVKFELQTTYTLPEVTVPVVLDFVKKIYRMKESAHVS